MPYIYRDLAHLGVSDAVTEAEISGDGDAGRLVVEPLLRDGGPVGEVAEREAAAVEDDERGGHEGRQTWPLTSRARGHLSSSVISVIDLSVNVMIYGLTDSVDTRVYQANDLNELSYFVSADPKSYQNQHQEIQRQNDT